VAAAAAAGVLNTATLVGANAIISAAARDLPAGPLDAGKKNKSNSSKKLSKAKLQAAKSHLRERERSKTTV
jgi:hypothetical protein